MIETMTIRSARTQEYQILSDLAYRSKGYWGYSKEFMEACRSELSISIEDIKSPQLNYFVAEHEGKILGYYAAERLSDSQYELEALFVDPQYIGHGVGRALIEHAKNFVFKRGAKSLLIQGDPNAVNFYKAAGGVQIGERESDSIPGRYLPEFMIYL